MSKRDATDPHARLDETDPFAQLSEAEREELRASLQRAEAEIAAGRTTPAEDLVRELRSVR